VWTRLCVRGCKSRAARMYAYICKLLWWKGVPFAAAAGAVKLRLRLPSGMWDRQRAWDWMHQDMSLSDHYSWRALQIQVSQPTWRREREYSKMLGKNTSLNQFASSS